MAWKHAYIYCDSDTANGGKNCTGALGTWNTSGGTSFAAPIWAGIQALVDQKTDTRQGNPNPIYYCLAAGSCGSGGAYGAGNSANCNSTNGTSANSACIFHDVTMGDTDVPCLSWSPNCLGGLAPFGVLSTSTTAYSPAYGAASSWDFATGIGTPDVANLVSKWPSSAAGSTTLNLPANIEWYDTGVSITNGDLVTISATGSVYIGAVSIGEPNISDYQTPAGDPGTTTAAQTGRAGPFAAPGLVPWSLVGKIGQSGTPFEIGLITNLSGAPSGELYLSVNDNNFSDNSGFWSISIRWWPT